MAGEVIAKAPPVTAIRFDDDGRIPNNRLPLLVYPEAVARADASVDAMEALLARNGWPPRWVASIFTYHHYHSSAHEVLGVASGRATVMMGGPSGAELDIAAGDVIVIPAGVGHKRLTSSSDFLVVGGYPPGQEWDLLRGDPNDRPVALDNIARVPLPQNDPAMGADGPLLSLWG